MAWNPQDDLIGPVIFGREPPKNRDAFPGHRRLTNQLLLTAPLIA